MEPVLNLQGVSKIFHQGEEAIRVLDDVSLEVHEGEMVSLLGKSGSGKTTLLDLIGGVQSPDSGSIVINGERIDQMSESDRTAFRRERIGMVFQFFNLIPTLKAIENVRFPLRLTDGGDEGRVRELLSQLGIEDRAQAFPSTLSGGEKQRVAIARALVHSPSIILADEPTGNLDHDHARDVLETFRTLCKEQNVALVMGTHSEDCARFCDRILRLRSGALTKGLE